MFNRLQLFITMSYINRLITAYRSGNFISRLCSFFKAKILFSMPKGWRARLFSGDKYYCPICDTHLRDFLRFFRPYHRWCPVCKSLARHRFVWTYFHQTKLPIHGKNLRILHIAPEDAIRDLFLSIPGVHYISGDLNSKKAMEKMDICNINYPANSFDLIFCSHVLEHVEDDHQALREFHRVLSSDGQLMLMVPILGVKTFQDPSITNPVDRECLFGQLDHVRAYGSDFVDIVASEGFVVETFLPRDFLTDEDIRRQQLDVQDRLFVCKKR